MFIEGELVCHNVCVRKKISKIIENLFDSNLQ